ncbi:MAG: C13 family peptidase [Candidatus Aegiribacteria sp.]|nr:C13 family peptidase [Candidatus Aegiribacteria sp.]
MLSILLSSIILSVVLPNSAEIETITAGQQATIDVSSGEGWVRILEDDYICLKLSVPDGIILTAFDENSDILCQSESGSDMILSAFADYWFYIQLICDAGYSSSSAEIVVGEVPPSELSHGDDVEGVLGRNVMAETYTFSPGSRGRWTFRLNGTGGTDLDLEVYGTNMSFWGSSMSLEGFETVTVSVLPGEVVTAVVSRYGKSGSGEYEFSVEPSGQFPEFDLSGLTESIAPGEIHRYLISGHESSFFLDLAILSSGADIDLLIRDTSGEYLMSSESYASIETLLFPSTGTEVVADVILYDTGDNETVSYGMYTREPGPLSNLIPVKEVVNIDSGRNLPVGFCPILGGLFRISVNFEKTRDGDVRVFRETGEPTVTFATARGDEEFLLYVSEGDTVWIDPFFANMETTGDATVRISLADAATIEGEYFGEISENSHTEFFTVRAESETILDIGLTGEDREVNLDLFVTGPDFDLIAEGWLSNVDAAGDEAVEVYAEKSAEYGITVYLYDRSGQTPFRLEVNRIERTALAEPSPLEEIWAISAGISGYSSSADILNRASMDAVEMYDFLIEDQRVPADHVILLVDAMATSEEFISGISSLLSSAGPEDKVIVFYSGHGDQSYPGSGGAEEPDSANEYLCLYDDEISDDQIAALIDSLAVSPVFLFFDACHSGGFVNDFSDGSNVLILTAAREDLSVSERILTPILLQGSRGDADSNGNGYVSALELMTYIDEKLQLICPECDAELAGNTYVCPECGAVLKGDNAVPRPQQGMFLNEDVELWKIR